MQEMRQMRPVARFVRGDIHDANGESGGFGRCAATHAMQPVGLVDWLGARRRQNYWAGAPYRTQSTATGGGSEFKLQLACGRYQQPKG
jgi:hypothetical protein